MFSSRVFNRFCKPHNVSNFVKRKFSNKTVGDWVEHYHEVIPKCGCVVGAFSGIFGIGYGFIRGSNKNYATFCDRAFGTIISTFGYWVGFTAIGSFVSGVPLFVLPIIVVCGVPITIVSFFTYKGNVTDNNKTDSNK